MSRLELCVLLVVAAVGAAIGLPALARARAQSRLVDCQNNLRTIGVAIYTFADKDSSGRLCTGLPDWFYDGCPDSFGWVADLRATKGADDRFLALCPSNPAEVPETFEDIIGSNNRMSVSQMSPVSEGFVNAGRCSALAVSFAAPHDAADSGSIEGASSERVDIVRSLIDDGYTTNYAASWLLARTGHLNKLSEDGTVSTREGATSRHRSSTIGPLTIRTIDSCPIPSSLLPLLADAAPSRRAVAGLQNAGMVTAQRPAATTVSGISSYYNARRDVLVAMPPGTIIRPENYDDPKTWGQRPYCKDRAPTVANPKGDAGMDGKLWLSDTRGWQTVHRTSTGQLNVLMADGSVSVLTDTNGDGLINPGFGVIDNSRTRFRDSTTEVFAGTMYTLGELRTQYSTKSDFE